MQKLKYAGITGAILFWLMVIINGFIYPNYSHLSQFISELGAMEAPLAFIINYGGIVPFGVGILFHSLYLLKEGPSNKTRFFTLIFLGLSGILFVIAGFYNCDARCSFEGISTEGLIHNISAMFAFLLAVFAMISFGIGSLFELEKLSSKIILNVLSLLSIVGFLVIAFEGIESPIRGVYQRVFLINFSIWIGTSSFLGNSTRKEDEKK
tara:strand:- start:3323 stop:3949 length:627 start_codon:yes stop_codon:yes gene_type:complete